jgi:hypothetical protein
MKYLYKILTSIVVALLVTFSIITLQDRAIFDTRDLVRIDPVPKTLELVEESRYSEAYNYLSFFMNFDYVQENEKAVELYRSIEEKRDSFEYNAKKVIEGVIKGDSDENIGKLSAIASDFLVIGDIRDLVIEGKHYMEDKDVDSFVVALSTLGLLATASNIYTLGSTSHIKSSISVLKYGQKIKKIPHWLVRMIIKGAKVAKETKSLKHIKNILEPIYKLYDKVGIKQTLNLIKKTKNLDELQSVVKISKRFGKSSGELIKVTGKRSIKYINSMPNVKKETILLASTYGEKGIVALKKLGQSKFLRRVKFTSRFTKIVYKHLPDMLPTWLLILITISGFSYFIYQFYNLRKIFKTPIFNRVKSAR